MMWSAKSCLIFTLSTLTVKLACSKDSFDIQSTVHSLANRTRRTFKPGTPSPSPSRQSISFSTHIPTSAPTSPTSAPMSSSSSSPTSSPSSTSAPTSSSSSPPTSSPTSSSAPTSAPTSTPTSSFAPTSAPTFSPTSSFAPSSAPTTISPKKARKILAWVSAIAVAAILLGVIISFRVYIWYMFRDAIYSLRQYGCFKWCSKNREPPPVAGGTLNEVIFEPIGDQNSLTESLLT